MSTFGQRRGRGARRCSETMCDAWRAKGSAFRSSAHAVCSSAPSVRRLGSLVGRCRGRAHVERGRSPKASPRAWCDRARSSEHAALFSLRRAVTRGGNLQHMR